MTAPQQFGRLSSLVSGIKRASTWGASLSGVGIALIMIGTVADVVGRKIFGHGVPSMIAYSEALLVVVVAFGLARAEQDKSHIRTSLITRLFPPLLQRIVSMVLWSIVTAFLVWMTIRTGISAATSFGRGESSLLNQAIPLWPGRAAMTVGLTALTLQAALNAYFARDTGGDEYEVESNEDLRALGGAE